MYKISLTFGMEYTNDIYGQQFVHPHRQWTVIHKIRWSYGWDKDNATGTIPGCTVMLLYESSLFWISQEEHLLEFTDPEENFSHSVSNICAHPPLHKKKKEENLNDLFYTCYILRDGNCACLVKCVRGLMSNLVICKFRKMYDHAWHRMSLLRPGVI